MTILLVEDDGEQRAVIGAHLRTAGHVVQELSADDQVIDHVRAHGPSLVLLDVEMPGLNGFTVLADDDPEVARIVDAHMRVEGFSTTIAFDGQQALEAVEREQPDVLILDLMMPKMTGFDVLHRIRALADKPRVIVLSARGREQDVTRAFDLGADDYMMKPFSPQELRARIGRLLR
ncbi:MAG TPA: response regulator [Vicinamibacterales bacterium]|nr:response regulator [Vicinamibacterales bacterium]